MKRLLSFCLCFIFLGCYSANSRNDIYESNYQAVLDDMKDSGFVNTGDDGRFFAIKSVYMSPYTTKESVKNKIYKASLKWMQKYEALGHFKIKYIDKEKKEIYGIGAITIASNKALVFEINVFCDALAGVKFYNWETVGIPPANFRRNFERESHGDYPQNWDAIKPAFYQYFNSYWSDVLEPNVPK